jgi:predicted aldo/keto reductase-like oxidoreductase
MVYKQYGKTGCRVSAVGFGGMQFDEKDELAGRLEACADVVRYAHERGINYFDTAPLYCYDKSETIMGLALKDFPRDSFYVGSKTNFGQVDRPATEAGFMRRLENSLKRLQVSYIDFYHLWCMLSLTSYRKQCDAMYGWFLKAKEQGLIRHIVFSSHMPGADIAEVIGEGLFEGVLLGYNALNYRYRQSGITAAAGQSMGVAVMNPLGGGLIPQNPELFAFLTEGTELTVPQAALRFVASHREVSVALNGITSKAHVDDALSAVEGLQERPAQEITANMRGKGFDDLCTGCGYCKGCPQDIPIPKFMDAYNQKMLGKDAVDRLNNHWAVSPALAKKCTACGRCEGLCTQHLPIVNRLREIVSLSGE